jgi:hypothetical protein
MIFPLNAAGTPFRVTSFLEPHDSRHTTKHPPQAHYWQSAGVMSPCGMQNNYFVHPSCLAQPNFPMHLMTEGKHSWHSTSTSVLAQLPPVNLTVPLQQQPQQQPFCFPTPAQPTASSHRLLSTASIDTDASSLLIAQAQQVLLRHSSAKKQQQVPQATEQPADFCIQGSKRKYRGLEHNKKTVAAQMDPVGAESQHRLLEKCDETSHPGSKQHLHAVLHDVWAEVDDTLQKMFGDISTPASVSSSSDMRHQAGGTPLGSLPSGNGAGGLVNLASVSEEASPAALPGPDHLLLSIFLKWQQEDLGQQKQQKQQQRVPMADLAVQCGLSDVPAAPEVLYSNISTPARVGCKRRRQSLQYPDEDPRLRSNISTKRMKPVAYIDEFADKDRVGSGAIDNSGNAAGAAAELLTSISTALRSLQGRLLFAGPNVGNSAAVLDILHQWLQSTAYHLQEQQGSPGSKSEAIIRVLQAVADALATAAGWCDGGDILSVLLQILLSSCQTIDTTRQQTLESLAETPATPAGCGGTAAAAAASASNWSSPVSATSDQTNSGPLEVWELASASLGKVQEAVHQPCSSVLSEEVSMQQKYNCIDAALQQIAWATAFEVQHMMSVATDTSSSSSYQ